jgi:Fe-S-cluster containining protein
LIPLPQIEPCAACGGKCCQSIGLPPFECRNPDLGGDPRLATLAEFADTPELLPPRFRSVLLEQNLFLAMPEAVRAAHAAVLRDLAADPSGSPCLWLDRGTGRCAQYAWRPDACRQWDVGGDGCLDARQNKVSVVFRGDGSVTQFTDPLAPQPGEFLSDGTVVTEPAVGGRPC